MKPQPPVTRTLSTELCSLNVQFVRLEVFDHVPQYLVQLDIRFITYKCIYLSQVRNAAFHVFESFSVCFFIWDQHYRRRRSGNFLDLFGEPNDGYFLIIPNVENIAYGPRMAHQIGETTDHFADIREAPSLLPITKYPDRLSVNGRPDEIWDHHSIPPRLAWPNRVEHSNDDNRQPIFPLI